MPRARQVGGFSDELDPYVDLAEVGRFDRVGKLLRGQRPVPRQDFMTRLAAEGTGETPAGLWPQVGAALAIGLVLLALGLLGASGSGPFGG